MEEAQGAQKGQEAEEAREGGRFAAPFGASSRPGFSAQGGHGFSGFQGFGEGDWQRGSAVGRFAGAPGVYGRRVGRFVPCVGARCDSRPSECGSRPSGCDNGPSKGDRGLSGCDKGTFVRYGPRGQLVRYGCASGWVQLL